MFATAKVQLFIDVCKDLKEFFIQAALLYL